MQNKLEIGQDTENWREKRKKALYNKRYREKNPWRNHLHFSRSRAKRKGWEHSLNIQDFKELWFRDKAWELKKPSIDRIDSSKGYIHGNCRFIERSENARLGVLGREASEKQRETVRKNIMGWALSHRGEKHPLAKLTESIVREIRFFHAQEGISFEKLAKKFKVAPQTISCIVKRKTWKHI